MSVSPISTKMAPSISPPPTTGGAKFPSSSLNSKDLKFLNALQSIFDSSELALYQLSTNEQSFIDTGRNEIKEGKFHNHDEVISEMRKWLKKK